MENCVDSPFVKNFGCIIFAFRASLDWLTLQVIKLVRMGDYYRVTNLWLLLYYREFRRLKITVMLVWEKVRLDLPQSSSQLQRVRLGGASRHTTLVTTKAVSPAVQPWCWWRPTVALEQVEFCAVHTLIPDGAQKLLCVVTGTAAPWGPMPAPQSRDKLSVREAGVQRALWLLWGCWAGCELEFCFPLLTSLQVQACFLRCRWGWSSPRESAWPRPQQSLAFSLHLYFSIRCHPFP